MKKLALAAAAATLLIAPVALADDGDDYAFTLVNQSTTPATSFVTKRVNGSWSSNWLATPIGGKQSRALRFNPEVNDTRCQIQTKMTFSDGSSYDEILNYCKVSQVVATEDNFYSK